MEYLLEIISFISWGLIVGTFVGLTSIGIGLIGVPGLIMLFKVDPIYAVGTMGTAGFIMMFSSMIQHLKNNNIEKTLTIRIMITSVPTAYFTAKYAEQINNIIPVKNLIGFIIVISVVLLFYRYFLIKKSHKEVIIPKWKLNISPLIGIILGILMGATSISGSIILIAFLLIFKLPVNLAIGSTSAVSTLSLLFADIAHFQSHHINFFILFSMLPAVLIAPIFGAKLSHKIPLKITRLLILSVLLIAGIMVILNK